MQLLDAILKWRAVRSFKTTDVSDEVLRKLLDLAVQAPSALNRQPWTFVIVQGRERLRGYSTRAKHW
jgi:nitroreductase